MLSVDVNSKKQSYELGIFDDDEEIVTLSLETKKKKASKVDIPKSTTEINSEDELEEYFADADLDEILNALDKAGVPEEYLDSVAEVDDDTARILAFGGWLTYFNPYELTVGTQVIPYLERSRKAKDEQIISGWNSAAVSSYYAEASSLSANVTYEITITSTSVNIGPSGAKGITNIEKADFAYAKKLDSSIKLLGLSCIENGKCMCLVAPFMVKDKHPLSMVRGVFNAVMVKGNMVGDTLFYGQGAGKLATASAIVADIVDCAINKGCTINCLWKDEEAELSSDSEKYFKYFIRVKKEAFDGLSTVIKSEKIVSEDICDGEIGFVSEKICEEEFFKIKEKFKDSIINYIRLLDC